VFGTPPIPIKARRPRLPPRLVARDRLVTLIEEGVARGLVLVSAPAGFGKSTAVNAAVEALALPTAWVTLDATDDAHRCLSLLDAAVRAATRAMEGAPVGQDASLAGPANLEEALEAWAYALAEAPQPLILVIDDLHAARDDGIVDHLRVLIEQRPPALRLILATREDPPLPWPRWRVRGELVEVRARDLRFGRHDADGLLNGVGGLRLSPDEVASLVHRTEGWVAGLQLAAATLQSLATAQERRGFVERFAGDDRYVLDYLLGEVLATTDTAMRRFLLRTAVLETLSAPLCQALDDELDEPTCQDLIERMERSNLFTVALDHQRRWYRRHRLFADLLRLRLQREHPDWVAPLHARAAAWYRDQGQATEAFRHAVAAADWDLAAAVIEGDVVGLLDQGDLEGLAASLRRVPEEARRRRPWLLAAQAWAQANGGEVTAVEDLLATLSGTLDAAADDADRRALLGHLRTLEAFVHGYRGDMERAAAVTEEALKLLPESGTVAASYGFALLGAAFHFDDQPVRARAVLSDPRGLALRSGPVPVILRCRLAEVQRVMGDLRGAERTYLEAMALHPGDHPPAYLGFAWTGLAAVRCERGDLEAAVALAADGLERCERWGQSDALVHAAMDAGRAFQAAGQRDAALAAADRLVEVAARLGDFPHAYAQAHRARLHVLLGRPEAARRWAAGDGWADAPVRTTSELAHLARAELDLADGRAEAAADRLAQVVTWAASIGASGRQREALVLRAAAHTAAGRPDLAERDLATALDLAGEEGLGQAARDHRQRLGPALAALADRDPRVRAFRPWEPDERAAADAASPSAPGADPAEMLTAREREVLVLLAEGATNARVAQRLGVSLATVKTHAASIYAKLGVHNRGAAVAKGRRRGWLNG
jgi:LuxR family transcriptional regulator, maltose regulon positive regulatory protein